MFEFYENETFSFGYHWNRTGSIRFPMEFTYIPNRDLIVLVDELYAIQCYQYQELAMNSTTNVQNEDGRKVSVSDWSYAFGEPIIDIQTVKLDKWYVVILGEKNLCILRDNGTLFFVKKFDANPSCLCAFANDQKDSIITLIGTQMSNMLVYQNDILRWATKIPFIPVAIRRANLNDIAGSIVLLSDQGQLTVGYLGTNPSLRIIALPSLADSQNNEKIEEELRELKKIINFEQTNNNPAERDNRLANAINLNLIECHKNHVDNLTMIIEMIPLTTISKVKLMPHQNDFYDIIPNEMIIDNLDDKQRFNVEIKFKINLLPLSTKIKYAIIYSIDNVSRIITKNLHIPFDCLVKLIPSSSTSASNGRQKYSIKLTISKQSLDIKSSQLLANLFDDLFENQTNYFNSNSFSFCFHNYEQIQSTIKLQSMENILFIVESNDLSGLYVSFQQLLRRITNKWTQNKSTTIKIESIQLNFNLIDHLRMAIRNRMERKIQLKKFKDEVAKFSQHHRVLQKRILVKSKDKTPASLNNLSKLLTLIQKRVSYSLNPQCVDGNGK